MSVPKTDNFSKFYVHFGNKYMIVEPTHKLDGSPITDSDLPVLSLIIDRQSYSISLQG